MWRELVVTWCGKRTSERVSRSRARRQRAIIAGNEGRMRIADCKRQSALVQGTCTPHAAFSHRQLRTPESFSLSRPCPPWYLSTMVTSASPYDVPETDDSALVAR